MTSIVGYGQGTAQTGSPWEEVVSVCNNIFYNVPNKNGAFKFYKIASFKFNGNVYWADPSPSSPVAHYGLYTFGAEQPTSGVLNIGSNLAYGNNAKWIICHTGSTTGVATPNEIDKLAESPFTAADGAAGTFTLAAGYVAYGPRR